MAATALKVINVGDKVKQHANVIGTGAPADSDTLVSDILSYPLGSFYLNLTTGQQFRRVAVGGTTAATDWKASAVGVAGATQAAVVTALTDSSGASAANGTIEAIATGTPADLAAQGVINGVIGNAIKELATTLNATLASLKTAGLMASA
jgi:hypothetical protein